MSFAVVTFAFARYLPQFSDPEWLRTSFEAYGPYAPVVFIIVQAAQILFAPIPGHVLTFIGGLLFGTIPGALYSLTGALIGSTIAFVIGRRYGRRFVENTLTDETITSFDKIVASDGRFALFLVFLIPGLPDDAVCFMFGITRIPLWQLIVISFFGRIPGYFVVSYAGSKAASAHYLESVIVVALVAVISVTVYLGRDRMLEWVHRLDR